MINIFGMIWNIFWIQNYPRFSTVQFFNDFGFVVKKMEKQDSGEITLWGYLVA